MNKNAYEIRLDILRMAHEELIGNYHFKLNTLEQSARDQHTTLSLSKIDELRPTSAEVIKKAKELYSFVNGD
jgi:hypothetical protein